MVVGGPGRPDPRAQGCLYARLPGEPSAVRASAFSLQVHALPAGFTRGGSHR